MGSSGDGQARVPERIDTARLRIARFVLSLLSLSSLSLSLFSLSLFSLSLLSFRPLSMESGYAKRASMPQLLSTPSVPSSLHMHRAYKKVLDLHSPFFTAGASSLECSLSQVLPLCPVSLACPSRLSRACLVCMSSSPISLAQLSRPSLSPISLAYLSRLPLSLVPLSLPSSQHITAPSRMHGHLYMAIYMTRRRHNASRSSPS